MIREIFIKSHQTFGTKLHGFCVLVSEVQVPAFRQGVNGDGAPGGIAGAGVRSWELHSWSCSEQPTNQAELSCLEIKLKKGLITH